MTCLVNEFESSVNRGDKLGHYMLTLDVDTGLAVVSELDRLRDIEEQYLDAKNATYLEREELERLRKVEEKYNLLMEPNTKTNQAPDDKMTLRDQIAIAVLNGLISNGSKSSSGFLVLTAYNTADLMLKQRGNVQ